MQADISPSDVIIRDVAFQKRHRAAEPYGLSPSFIKNGGEVLALEFKLLGPTWGIIKRITKTWCKSPVVPLYKKDNRSSRESYVVIICI